MLKTFTGVAMVEPIFNAIVAVRQISVSAKEVIVLAWEPRANGIAPRASMVLPQKAGSHHARQQTPVLPERASSTPPKVLPQFAAEPTPRRGDE